jgi:outer membrane receptor protein involved in Fe transport
MHFTSKVLRSLLLGSTAAALAAPAWAQTGQEEQAQATANPSAAAPENDEEVLVTATKRSSRVQDVPFSINAQTQKDIQRANANTVEEISRNVAGLAVQNLGPGQSQVSVRGVSAGQIVRDQPGVKEQVGVYLDESVVSLSLFSPDFDLFDLNRVETLRGPQGTLFGSGSVGGTLRYITNQPKLGETSALLEGNINIAEENDLGGHLKGAVNLPLGNTMAFRVVGYYTEFPGFIDAEGAAAGKNKNDGHRLGVRAALLWEPADNIKITPRIVYQEARANGFNREEIFNLAANEDTGSAYRFGDREQYLRLGEKFEDDTFLADLTGSVDLGPVELTSVTSYLSRDILVSRDASALSASVTISPLIACCGFSPAAIFLPSNLQDTTEVRQFTQELRAASTGDGPLQWVAGVFYSDVDRFYQQRLPTPGYDFYTDLAFGPGTANAVSTARGFPADSPYSANLPFNDKQFAIFGEGSYDFGQFKLTAGVRYFDFKEKRDFVSGGLFSNLDTQLGVKTKSDGFSPRAIVTYEPNRNLSVNVQASKGFRLGGVNDPLNLGLCTGGVGGIDAQTYGGFPTFKDETSWNYEAGVKYQRSGITFNAAAFYNDVTDLQVNVDAGTCSSRITLNADAHTMGVEAEVSAKPMPGLELSLAGSVLEAEFDESRVTVAGAVISGLRKGNRLPSVPKFQMAATATYGARLSGNADWYVTGSVQHIGSRYTQPGDQEAGAGTFTVINFFGPPQVFNLDLKLPSYELVNLSFGVEFDSGLDVILYANNVFDESPKLSFDRERGGRARLGFHVGQPRIIGLTLRKAFGR